MFLYKSALLCLLLLFLSTAAHAKIVFSSTRDGVKGIYVMEDDGNNQTLLTESEELQPFPSSWSPDGKRILFKRRIRVHRAYTFFLMDPDGTNIRQLIENDNDSYFGKASFSPDGKFIVYDRDFSVDHKEKYSIEVLNIKTGETEVILSDMNVTFCDWSPDGKHIIFTEPMSPGREGTVWIMGADGHKPRRLIPVANGAVAVQRWCPRWSPDGNQIAFYQEEYVIENIDGVGNARIDRAFRLMICNRNGTNVRQLRIPKDWKFSSLDWMDNGKSIVFSASVGIPLDEPLPRVFEWPPYNVYKYHIKTGEITQLTDDPGWDQTVDWISDDVLPVSPQGKKKVTWGTLKQ